jgi:hypothetical protein
MMEQWTKKNDSVVVEDHAGILHLAIFKASEGKEIEYLAHYCHELSMLTRSDQHIKNCGDHVKECIEDFVQAITEGKTAHFSELKNWLAVDEKEARKYAQRIGDEEAFADWFARYYRGTADGKYKVVCQCLGGKLTFGRFSDFGNSGRWFIKRFEEWLRESSRSARSA